ncbi:hypothetical protein LTS18_003768 [Coniosporium uncinatum]|uniref:Uncharacterized protein n=1 Tax=Coniosporium uncinatum TaxID=93489 RepID=A0ACC3DST5_9PEZI|nr:hypothetical protein LTS18_003768 [Coniosporium uncinatum]
MLAHESVSVEVDDTVFTLNKAGLCSVSPFFAATFNDSSGEATERSISLSDITVSTFRMFIEWFWARKLVHPDGDDDVTSWDFNELVDLYALDDKYNVPQLRKDIMEMAMNKVLHSPWIPSPNELGDAFRKLHFRSPLCRLFIDNWAWRQVGKNWAAAEMSWIARALPRSCLLSLLFALNKQKTRVVNDEEYGEVVFGQIPFCDDPEIYDE